MDGINPRRRVEEMWRISRSPLDDERVVRRRVSQPA
jgi:hypothetical protein